MMKSRKKWKDLKHKAKIKYRNFNNSNNQQINNKKSL